MAERTYLVVGAGLQGCGIALELARRGKTVALIERDLVPMNRASLRNEGKIHLGLIYAADPSGQTAQTQLRGALSFRRILRSWLGDRYEFVRQSTPFAYLVAETSLLSESQLALHYSSLEALYRAMLEADPTLDYLGSRQGVLAWPLAVDKLGGAFNRSRFKAAFGTIERAIDTDDLAREIRRAVSTNPRIEFCAGQRVVDLVQRGGAFEICLQDVQTGARSARTCDVVFNAAWEKRIELDQRAGMDVPADWLHRLKFRVIVSLPDSMKGQPSATIVLGAFGDVVVRDDSAYCSWYPAGLKGWSHCLAPPDSWDRLTGSAATDPDSEAIGRQIHEETLRWCPGLAGSKVLATDAGAIFAYGKTDVDRLESGLHRRSCVGVRRKGNFLSIDPGKLTTAPLFAVEAVREALACN